MNNNNEANEAKKKLGLADDVPMLNADAPDFKEQLDFMQWSTHSASDYRNDRERPYNGQRQTNDGERGKQLVSGLTMRDLRDCLIKAMLLSASSDKYLESEVFIKCWDYSKEPATPTQFLLDNQNDPDFISTKVECGNWRTQDVYKIDWNNINPIAITQNFTCEVEKMMGIYPNVPKLEEK